MQLLHMSVGYMLVTCTRTATEWKDRETMCPASRSNTESILSSGNIQREQGTARRGEERRGVQVGGGGGENQLSIHLHCVQYSIVICGYLMPAPSPTGELMLVGSAIGGSAVVGDDDDDDDDDDGWWVIYRRFPSRETQLSLRMSQLQVGMYIPWQARRL